MAADVGLLAVVGAAYQGFEDPASFSGLEDVLRYRDGLLERSREQAAFVAARMPGRRVLELGCGNGRLLVELARRGETSTALGVDIATSRIGFARRWAQDEDLRGVRFEAADAFSMDLEPSGYDAAVCITGALGYFGAVEGGLDGMSSRRMAGALAPGGLLVVELYPHPVERRLLNATGGDVRMWQELPPEDPWRFYLSELQMERRQLSTAAPQDVHPPRDRRGRHRTGGAPAPLRARVAEGTAHGGGFRDY